MASHLDPRILITSRGTHSSSVGSKTSSTTSSRHSGSIRTGDTVLVFVEPKQAQRPRPIGRAPSGTSFRWVQGDWVVPDVDAPTENQWYYSANWIGIDGDGSGDVCQMGVECEVFR